MQYRKRFHYVVSDENLHYDEGQRKNDIKNSTLPWELSPATAFGLLLCSRVVSAAYNIIHDCDEVFNYWEPLHFLLYNSGLQTWEYSAEFALRPYLYLLLHGIVGMPLSLIVGEGAGKVLVFYGVRLGLALVSAYTETQLYRATRQACGTHVANYLLFFLCISSGMFCASTALLPSSFTMYTMTSAAAAVLQGSPLVCEAYAAIGIIWGWAVAGLAFLPYAVYVLLVTPLLSSVVIGLLALVLTLVPMVLVDRCMYGKWTVSLWNFLKYNVVGGGDSALYGVEGPSFYFRNGVNNLNVVFLLGLATPLVMLLACLVFWGPRGSRGPVQSRLVVAVSPVFMWLAAITVLPHKEERFLYVVYPLVCLSAAWTLSTSLSICTVLFQRTLGLPRSLVVTLRSAASWLCVGVVALLSVSRGAALVRNYGAPMYVYNKLPQGPPGGPPLYVCTGTEWYRFPSSFFLPGATYRLQFIQSGFGGLLPHQYNVQQGGSAASPPYFNTHNRADPANYWNSTARCHYLVTYNPQHYEPLYDASQWEVVHQEPFVDVNQSPTLFRALYIPFLSEEKNAVHDYVLLRNKLL